MKSIKAVGFDLFNTLITVAPHTLQEANARLLLAMQQNGFILQAEDFNKAHKQAAIRHLEDCRKDGRETHNRFWISAALETFGYHVSPDDQRVAIAVEQYFSAFYDHCSLIPGTSEMLARVKESFLLGMLTNFTHGPAARKIIQIVGLEPFFDVILISGELGFRKPNPLLFQKLLEHLEVEKEQLVYVGDDLEPDIIGAQNAGVKPIWCTFVRDRQIPFAAGVLSPGPGVPDRSVPRISNWQELIALLE